MEAVNRFFDDPRVRFAERDAYDAEHLERQGKLAEAFVLWLRAGDAFGAVAVGATEDGSFPNTATELLESMVACRLRAAKCQSSQ